MSDAPFDADDLDATLDHAWTLIERGVADRGAALRHPVVSTLGSDGPAARVMVLRASDRQRHCIRFYTDRRAGKVAQMAGLPRAGRGYRL